MKLKVLLITLLAIGLGFASISQFAHAETKNPDIAPISTPISYFRYHILGDVTYRYNGSTFKAPNVTIQATNLTTKEKYFAKTNKQGQYSLAIPVGKFNVQAYDTERTRFNPLSQTVQVKDRNVPNINFSGVLHHAPIFPK